MNRQTYVVVAVLAGLGAAMLIVASVLGASGGKPASEQKVFGDDRPAI